MATRLKVIVFTDRVGSSAAATDIGDANRARVNQSQELITREIAAETRGLVIKFLGDGHLLTFDSASDGLRAGYHIQARITEYNAGANEALRFHLRIGADVGDVDVDVAGDVRRTGRPASISCIRRPTRFPGSSVRSSGNLGCRVRSRLFPSSATGCRRCTRPA